MREIVFKSLKFIGLLRYFKSNIKHPTILCFHRVSCDDNSGYPPMKPEVFDGLMAYVVQHFDVVDLSEIQNREGSKPKLAITFDDGYMDFKTDALPILAKYNIPVTLNIITDCAETGVPHWTQRLSCLVEVFAAKNLQPTIHGKGVKHELAKNSNEELVALELYHLLKSESSKYRNSLFKEWENELKVESSIYTKMLTWENLSDLLRDYPQLRIGSHTCSHPNLKELKDPATIEQEIIESAKIIESNLGIKIDRFAFPNGEFNDLAISVIEKSNYKYVQLTEIQDGPKNTSSQIKFFKRTQPYYSSLEENIFCILGFHERFRRK